MNIRFVASVLALSCVSTSATPQSAQEMLSFCRSVVAAEVAGEYATFDPTFNSGQCWGAFSAAQEAVRYGSPEGPPARLLNVCPPAEVKRTQYVAVFNAYAQKHPEQLHLPWLDVALTALAEAFPCS